ncbi:MAG: M23 family metallopeptidase [Clostridia bacterium]|nr:M23 family metallopeptidase [Clostridia bacterium]
MKNKVILVVLFVLCLIPTVIAISSYNKTQNAPVDNKTAVQISISDINEKTYIFHRDDSEEAVNMIDFFLKMRNNASEIVGLPDSLTGKIPFKVTLSSRVKNETYLFYFNPDPASNYFQDPAGKAYQIAEDDATAFITTEYAESIYETATMPVLTLSNTYPVSPDQAIWQYKNYTGSYVDSDVSGTVEQKIEEYALEGGFDLQFDLQPDYFMVKILDDAGNLIFDDVYENLVNELSFKSNTKLNVTVTAKWYEDPSRSFCGELVYNFDSTVSAPAEFHLGMQSVKAGRFVAVTATNVLYPERVQFSSEPSLNVSPVFFQEGEYAVALLPIDPDTAGGNYTLTFVYGGTTQSIPLTIEGQEFATSNMNDVSATILNLYRTSDTIAEFEQTAASIMDKSITTRHFSGSFLGNAKDMGGTIMRGFGRTIVINENPSNTYRNNGVDYNIAEGNPIKAANAGEVVYVGILDYTGNIVVIDHGLGLKTWYYNMGSFSVEVGNIVAKGDTIGTSGKTGFAKDTGVHIAMSVGHSFVSPYDTWSDNDDAGKVKIWGIDP